MTSPLPPPDRLGESIASPAISKPSANPAPAGECVRLSAAFLVVSKEIHATAWEIRDWTTRKSKAQGTNHQLHSYLVIICVYLCPSVVKFCFPVFRG
jgi:hypothetical protein